MEYVIRPNLNEFDVDQTRWTGPISVALFVPDVEFTIALVFIEYLRNCFPNVRDRVSFHMIYPGERGQQLCVTDREPHQ